MSIFRWSLTWFVREKERCNCFVLPDIFAVTYGLLAEQQGWCYSKVWNEVIVNWSWKLINKRETFFYLWRIYFFQSELSNQPCDCVYKSHRRLFTCIIWPAIISNSWFVRSVAALELTTSFISMHTILAWVNICPESF